jgi:hypothetical protein
MCYSHQPNEIRATTDDAAFWMAANKYADLLPSGSNRSV